MKRIIISALALVIAATSVPAFAQRYENRESRQDWRIYRGLATGGLTPREYRNLERQQRRIDRAQWRAERDGVVTRREARRIERLQDRASRNIRRKTHNARGYW